MHQIRQTLHYKTAYILYNEVTRNYYVYSIISNQITHDDDSTTTANSDDIKGVVEYTLPIPQNTIQLKFTSHTIENIQNYIIECQYCCKICDISNYSRWHGDKCKMKPNID